LLTLSASGCASFWDEVFSRERDLGSYFNPPNPLITIVQTTDGERRAKALACLREPAQHGGSQQDQDKFVEILTTAAETDRDPYCRLGAIQALGYFKDARAAQALEKVVQQSKLPFTQDFNAMIRQTTLRSLVKIGSDDARRVLVLIARSPGPTQDASSLDRQQTQDEKMIAIRAMGKYHQTECTEALVFVLETEKDIALRDCAHQALQESTGKTLPPDPQVWRMALAGQPVNVETPNLIQRVAGWFK
jgi:Holliday junction resolvasome RuvABC DNA-binding subunit